jgi:DNA-binding NarL/FixJ family response regulator
MKKINSQIAVGIADEQPIFSSALSYFLEKKLPFASNICWTVHSGRRLMEKLRTHPVQLLITELKLREIDGVDVLEQIKDSYSSTRILVLSQYDQQKFVKMAFSKGVDGYVLKQSDEADLLAGITDIIQGNVYMGEGVNVGPKKKTDTAKTNRENEFAEADRFRTQNEITNRELEILEKIDSGLNIKQIAKALFISDQTVAAHKRNLMRKFSVHSRRELLEKSRKHKVL